MATNTFSQRLKDIRDIQQDYKLFYQLGGGLSILVIGIWIGSLIFAHDNGYATNAFTEILSVIATVVLLDRLNDFRQQRRDIEALKQKLVMDAASLSNEKAKDAVNQLRKQDWLMGDRSLLSDADLREANLATGGLEGNELSCSQL